MSARLMAVSLVLLAAWCASQPTVVSSDTFILSRPLFTLAPSAPELILSPNLENLQLTLHPLNGRQTTQFQMNVFNRRGSGNLIHYNFTAQGAWSYLLSSAGSLSCSLVVEEGKVALGSVGLLSFDSQTGNFQILGTMPFTSLSSLTTEQLRNSLRLGQNCRQGGLLFVGDYQAYRGVDNWTGLAEVALPSDWQPQALSQDLRYAISQQQLYRYNDNSYLYEALYQLPFSPSYNLRNYRDRIIVMLSDAAGQSTSSGFRNASYSNATNQTVYNFQDVLRNISNSTNITNLTTDVFQFTNATNITVIVLTYQPSLIEVVGQFEATSLNIDHQITVLVSPQLTKLAIVASAQSRTFTIAAKTIDFQARTISDLAFPEQERFLQTLMTADLERELDFNDYFIVVRNGSSYLPQAGNTANNSSGNQTNNSSNLNFTNFTNSTNSTPEINVSLAQQIKRRPNCLLLPTAKPPLNPPCILYPPVRGSLPQLPIQEVYQFVGNEVVLLRSRNLLNSINNIQLQNFVKTYIDVSTTDRAVIVNQFKLNQTRFRFYQYEYGTYVKTAPFASIPPYLSFVEPQYTAAYSQKGLLQWTYFNNMKKQTRVSSYAYDSTLPTHYRVSRFLVAANSELLYQNERCMIILSPQSISIYTYSAILKTFVYSGDLTPLLVPAINNTATNDSTMRAGHAASVTAGAVGGGAVEGAGKDSANCSKSNTTSSDTKTTDNITVQTKIVNNKTVIIKTVIKKTIITQTIDSKSSCKPGTAKPPTATSTLETTLQLNKSEYMGTKKWQVSADGSRIFFKNKLLIRQQSTLFKEVTISKSTIVTMDQQLQYALSQQGQLYSYDFSSQRLVLLRLNLTFASTSVIRTYEQRMVIYGRNHSSFYLHAYRLEKTNILRLCLSYELAGVTLAPNVYLSPQLGKILVLPQKKAPAHSNESSANNFSVPASSSQSNFYNFSEQLSSQSQVSQSYLVYCVDYQQVAFTQVPIPAETVSSFYQVHVVLDESFIYIRQLQSANYSKKVRREYAYYFSQNVAALEVFQRFLSDTDIRTWQETLIVQRNTQIFIVNQQNVTSTQEKKVSVVQEQVSSLQAQINSQSTTYTTQIIRGQLQICPIGCADCICTSCLDGYTFDSDSRSCKICPGNCRQCQTNFANICTVCWPGSFLDASSRCQPCAKPCVTCAVSPTQCTSCLPGHFFNSRLAICSPCPANCDQCSSASSCFVCSVGFTLSHIKGASICQSCSLSCTSCNPHDITECSGCAAGLQLVEGRCVKCAANCLKCYGGRCGLCAQGYMFNSRGLCVLKCQLPCITCVDNKPHECLSCQFGSTLVNRICEVDLRCSLSNTCSTCSQGSGYFLAPQSNGASCQKCPSLPNCIQCDYLNFQNCAICKAGYYVDEGVCSPCVQSCRTCSSESVCLGCSAGYTLLSGYKQGTCLKCESPCATCVGSTSYCTSCLSGYVMKAWKCISDNYVSFTCTFNQNSSYLLSNINLITVGILQILRENATFSQNLVYTSIVGSTVTFDYTITTQTVSAIEVSQSLMEILTTSGIPGTTIKATKVHAAQYCSYRMVTAIDSFEQNGTTSSNVGLMLAMGLTLIVLLAVIVTLTRSKGISSHFRVQQLSEESSRVMVNSSEDGTNSMGSERELCSQKAEGK